MHRLMRGAIAGTVATIPMTLIMISLFRQLPAQQRYPLPPRLLTENFTKRLAGDKAKDDAALAHMTLGSHFGYGAATGAFFPYLERGARPQMLAGMAYGVGIWAASYLGWIPAAKLLAPATRHPARRNALMLAAHLVWGVSLAWISAALREQRGTFGQGQDIRRQQASSLNKIRLGELPFSRHADVTGFRPQPSPRLSSRETFCNPAK